MQFGTWARPLLAELVEETGETANLAVLERDEVVYVAQVPSKHSMRMFTEVGRRLLPHGTGVGKAMLAQLPADEVRALLARTGMPAYTEHTFTDPDALLDRPARDRRAGLRAGRERAGDRRAVRGGRPDRHAGPRRGLGVRPGGQAHQGGGVAHRPRGSAGGETRRGSLLGLSQVHGRRRANTSSRGQQVHQQAVAPRAVRALLVLAQHADRSEAELPVDRDRRLVLGCRVDGQPVVAACFDEVRGQPVDRGRADAAAVPVRVHGESMPACRYCGSSSSEPWMSPTTTSSTRWRSWRPLPPVRSARDPGRPTSGRPIETVDDGHASVVSVVNDARATDRGGVRRSCVNSGSGFCARTIPRLRGWPGSATGALAWLAQGAASNLLDRLVDRALDGPPLRPRGHRARRRRR